VASRRCQGAILRQVGPGTDVMIFKNIFATNSAKKIAFLIQHKGKLCKNYWVLRKTPKFASFFHGSLFCLILRNLRFLWFDPVAASFSLLECMIPILYPKNLTQPSQTLAKRKKH
jgi:hypothetical protein